MPATEKEERWRENVSNRERRKVERKCQQQRKKKCGEKMPATEKEERWREEASNRERWTKLTTSAA